jgi:predicted methyltransferase
MLRENVIGITAALGSAASWAVGSFLFKSLGEVFSPLAMTLSKWEKTSQVLEFLSLKPGSSVADVGCGPGYYTHKFSDVVGEDGLVYAVDTDTEELDYVGGSASRHGVRNIRPVRASLNDTKLPRDCADVVFLCSLYHGVYVSSLESVRDEFIASIKKALRKGGRLVIVDNDILPDDQVPYIGRRIDRRLIIRQLEHYGFRLVDSAQFVPQRYVLVFRIPDSDASACRLQSPFVSASGLVFGAPESCRGFVRALRETPRRPGAGPYVRGHVCAEISATWPRP